MKKGNNYIKIMLLKNTWITLISILTISSSIVCQTKSQSISENNIVENNSIVKNNDNNNSQMLIGDVISNIMKDFLPLSDVNKHCARDGQTFMESLNNQTLWAIRMYDSSSKYPRGMLSVEVIELGNFDQCMSVSSMEHGIYGAYAIAILQLRSPKNETIDSTYYDLAENDRQRLNRNLLEVRPEKILWALCFPDSCTNDDIKLSVEHLFISKLKLSGLVVNISVPPLLYTSKNSKMEYTIGVLLTIGIFIVGISLMIVGTSYDLLTDRLKPKNNTTFKKCLYSYSIVTSIKNLMSDPKNDEFSVTNGLKTMGILAVIIGHRVALDLGTPSSNPDFEEHIFHDFWLSILKSPVAVEIFFIISGFFTYIAIEKRLRSGKTLQFIYVLCYRLFRILPTYIIIILIFAFILPYMGDGPLWKLVIYPEAEFCRKNWWTNMLFINNYINSHEMCMVHAWYLACDLHFFIIGTILTYIILRWKKGGLGIFAILFVASIYIPAKYIYENNQWGVMPYFHNNIKNLRTTEHFQRVYIKSHFRITTYLIGLAAAYIYLRIKNLKFKFSVISRIIGLIICLLMHEACYIATGYLYQPGLKYNPWHHLLYFTIQRIVYSLTISYILVVGSLSNFGFVSEILKCKLFTVIARMSYVLYLTHFIIQLQTIGEIRQPHYGNFWLLYWKINADLTTALMYSLPINVIVEAPCRNIFNQLRNSNVQSGNNKPNSVVHEKNHFQTNMLVLSQFQNANKS